MKGRCVFVNQLIEVISDGKDYDELLNNLVLEKWSEKYFKNEDLTFRFRSCYLNAKPSQEGRLERVKRITDFVGQRGKVDLKKR